MYTSYSTCWIWNLQIWLTYWMNNLKKTTHDLTEPVDKQHYKKRYLLRKQEEQEADYEVKTYNDDERDKSVEFRREE